MPHQGADFGLTTALRLAMSYEFLFAFFLVTDSIELRFGLSTNISLPVMAICIGWGTLLILKKGIYVRGMQVVAAFLAFFAYILISYSWTPSRSVSMDRIQVFALLNVWCVVTGALIFASKRKSLVRFLIAMAFWGLVIAAIGLEVWWELGTVRKFSEDGRAHINWGNSVAPATIILFMVALYSKTLSQRQLIAGALFGVTVFYLIAGGGRGAFISALLPCLIPLLLVPAVRDRRLQLPKFQIIGLLIVSVSIVLLIFAYTAETQLGQTLGRLVRTFSEDSSVVKGATRLHYLPAAYQAWLEEPLFGHGIGAFPLWFRGFEQPGSYPHNIVLEILAELGLVGMAVFLLFGLSAARGASMTRLREDPMLLCALMLMTMALISAMVSSNLGGNRMLYFTIALLAIKPTVLPRSAPG